MPAVREVIRAWRCTCNRCEREWWSTEVELPRTCPSCRSDFWNTPRKRNVTRRARIQQDPARKGGA